MSNKPGLKIEISESLSKWLLTQFVPSVIVVSIPALMVINWGSTNGGFQFLPESPQNPPELEITQPLN